MQLLQSCANVSIVAASELVGNATRHAHLAAFYSHSADVLAIATRRAPDYVFAHPMATAALVVGVTKVAAPGLFAVPALEAAGFTANGVVAGSAAAVVQGGIGNVVAGSNFALAQSAAAGGYGVATINGLVQAVGVSVGAAGALNVRSKL